MGSLQTKINKSKPQQLFLYDEFQVLKDTLPQLEHPFYSLSKVPQIKERRYENNGKWFSVVPSSKGQPTIYDKDIMVYIVSHLMLMKKNKKINEISSNDVLRIKAKDYFDYTGRTRGGKGYKDLRNAILRLKGTVFTTNISSDGETTETFFTLIDNTSKIVEKEDPKTGVKVVDYFEVCISDWMAEAIRKDKVLTLHEDYFELKPVYKAIYELGRKHCGNKKTQSLKLETVHRKIGVTTPKAELRRTMKTLMKKYKPGEFPDYDVKLTDDDMVIFTNNCVKAEIDDKNDITLPPLDLDTFSEAQRLAPDFDNYDLHHQWQEWFIAKRIKPGLVKGFPNVELSVYTKSYLGFCANKQINKAGGTENQADIFDDPSV